MKVNTILQGDVLTKIKEICYLAGILDGEGSIMVRKNTYRLRSPKYNDCENPQYSPRIQIKMSNKEPLELMRNIFGGSLGQDPKVYQSKTGFKTNKRMWVYRGEHRIATQILNTLIPFLRVKKDQAVLALQIPFLKHKYNKRESNGKFQGQQYSKELIEELELVYKAVKRLNGGGE